MTTAQGQSTGKYLIVYVCLLAIMVLQFFIGYQHTAGPQLVIRFLTFAVIETLLVVLFWMNLGSENRLFKQFIIVTMLFVLATMNYIWTDSFRLLLFRVTGMGPS